MTSRKSDPPKTRLPWQLPVAEIPHDAVVAIKALADGAADQFQQRTAFAFIRDGLCEVEKMSFWPGGEDGRRATDFAEGKRWVGDQLRRIVRLQPAGTDPRGEPPPMPSDQTTEG